MSKKHIPLWLFAVFLMIAVRAGPAHAAVWTYKINSSETGVIDSSKTSAAVDTTNHEIRLPRSAPKTAGFEGSDLDYLVLSPTELKRFSWTGSSLIENTIIKVSGLSNPVAALASAPYPDAVVATSTGITHYTFSGSMSPAWTVSGLTGVVSIGTRDADVSVLAGGQVKYYGYTGSGAAQISALSITSGLSNPIDAALVPDTYDCVVLEPTQVKYFNWTGSALVQNPSLAITGLAAPKSVAVGDLSNVAVVDGSQVKVYTLSGGSFAYSAALSVTSGLTSPSCVAVRPGSYDLLIVDGDDVKYYMYTGTSMVYNAALSKTVAGLSNIGAYASSAVVTSTAKSSGSAVTSVRIRAYVDVPTGTSITFYLSTNGGSTWTASWRATNSGSPVLEKWNGSSWVSLGSPSLAYPGTNTLALWTTVASGSSIAWKADLATSNSSVTPKIRAPNPGTDDAVVWDTNLPPNPPTLNLSGSCYLTATPTITWAFNDPDAGDSQSAYQAVITTLAGSPVYDSGKVASSSTSFTVPGNVLFLSGEYQFRISVTTWDQGNLASSPASGTFCVVAFEYPRISEIVSPPPGQSKPDPSNPATHIPITQGMAEASLPKTKAGGKVGLLVNSIGVSSCSASVTYSGKAASTVGPTVSSTVGAQNRIWLLEFWTSASPAECPTGTRVDGTLNGTGTGGSPSLVLQKGAAGAWAEGIVTIEGTVLDDWFVVLQGRKS